MAVKPKRGPGRPKGSTYNIRGVSEAPVSGDGARVMTGVTYGDPSALGRYSQKCAVCNNPNLFTINEFLLLGRGYKMILSALPEDVREEGSQNYLTANQIRHHVSAGHIPIKQMAIQTIISDRMQQLGKAVEEHEGIVLDHIILGRVMLDSYHDALVHGRAIPGGSDVVAVMKMFAEIEKLQNSTIDASVYNQVIGVMIEVMREIVPVEQFDEIMFRVGENPLVRSLRNEREAQAALGRG